MQIDLNDPTRNMFGLKPCPECGSRYCWPTQPTHREHPSSVVCDDCGWHEPLEELTGGPAMMEE